MPEATAQVRASSWSLDDYAVRFAEMRAAWSEIPESNRTDDHNKTVQSLLNEREALDFEFRCLRAEQAARQTPERTEGTAGYGLPAPSRAEYRSAGEIVIANEAFANWLKKGHHGESPTIEFRGSLADQWRIPWQHDYELRTLVDDQTTTSSLLLPVAQPFLPAQAVYQQKLFIEDVLAGGSTTFNSVPYVRELNAVANQAAASTVAPAGLKPETKVEFVDDLAPVRDIAVTIPITNQTLEDNAVVVSYINNRLSYMVKLRREQQILTGSGTAPDLKGIMQYPVQTQAATSGDMATTLANAISKIEVTGGYPNAVAMSPGNYWTMVTHRASTAGTFDGAANGAPWNNMPATVWGLPVVRTVGLATNHALVGDFQLGAQIFNRSAETIRMFEQHSDWAAYNKQLIRVECRLALAIYRADWFVDAVLV